MFYGPYLVWLLAALAVWVLALFEYQRQQVQRRAARQGYWRGYQAAQANARKQTALAIGEGSIMLFINGVSIQGKLTNVRLYGVKTPVAAGRKTNGG